MAPSVSRSFGAASAAALHLPRAHSPFSRAAAAMTAAAFSRFRPSAGPRSLSTTGSCGVALVLGWKSPALGTRFKCTVSAAAEEVPGNDHQVSHLLDSAVQGLCTSKDVFLQDIARIYGSLKEKSYMITHNLLKGYHLSTDMSSSCEQQGLEVDNAELVKDKLLADCGPGQECVTGGVVALGKFDALHIGHRELAVQASKAGTPFLLSFAGMAKVLGWENSMNQKKINQQFYIIHEPSCQQVQKKERQFGCGVEFFKHLLYKEVASCRYFSWVDDYHHTTVDLKYQMLEMERSLQLKLEALERKIDILENPVRNPNSATKNEKKFAGKTLQKKLFPFLLIVVVTTFVVCKLVGNV